jgi:ATP-binding cassette subfamily F protein 3
MATYDIEGFPRHHRVLHVKQEIKASQRSVLEAVVTSDVERSQLLKREQEINDRAARRADGKELPGDPPAEEDAKELAGVYDRLIQIDAHSAEARAGAILHGLGFSDEQMAGTTAQVRRSTFSALSLRSLLTHVASFPIKALRRLAHASRTSRSTVYRT